MGLISSIKNKIGSKVKSLMNNLNTYPLHPIFENDNDIQIEWGIPLAEDTFKVGRQYIAFEGHDDEKTRLLCKKHGLMFYQTILIRVSNEIYAKEPIREVPNILEYDTDETQVKYPFLSNRSFLVTDVKFFTAEEASLFHLDSQPKKIRGWLKIIQPRGNGELASFGYLCFESCFFPSLQTRIYEVPPIPLPMESP